jgi:hypothetical protein
VGWRHVVAQGIFQIGKSGAPSIALNEIPCATLLRWAVLKAKFLYPGQFGGAVLDAGMLYSSRLSLSRLLAQLPGRRAF